ncbi:urease accessory protein UreD [Rothia terrae]|uniref:urease accessory protein UreD n=1 Tax=Rothia terrae TaxID=396015 RepID=UPI002881045A|nr:urease accessory protein UreD [Rothia terrae]MDT0189297.1 urease accessory protein UreD [Rothia terrae]
MATEHETHNWAGVLKLGVTERNGRSVATSQYHEGALRILRPHYLDASGQVTYTAINPGGAYFGADRYLLDLKVEQGASLLLTTQSATKVYKTPQGPAYQEMTVDLGPGAVFEYVPDQLIVYREGAYKQRTLVTMDPTASLVMSEIITPGWAPDGSSFKYQELRMRTEIRVTGEGGDKRLAVDQLRLKPSELGDIRGVGLMEGHSHTGQLLLADARIDNALYDELAAMVEGSNTLSGITRAGRDAHGVHCVAVRSLANSTADIAQLHQDIINLTRKTWRYQAKLDLRKH